MVLCTQPEANGNFARATRLRAPDQRQCERVAPTQLTIGGTNCIDKATGMIRNLFASSRYLFIIAVIGSFLLSAVLFVYGGIVAIQIGIQSFALDKISSKGAKTLAVAAIEVVDFFLLATVFYIIALGLYALFIDDKLPLPHWLEIHDFDDLKYKLTGVVIVAMGVLFLGQVVTWDGQRDLLGYGVAIGLVIAALVYFLAQKSTKGQDLE